VSQRIRSASVALYLLLCILLGGSAQGVWNNLALQLLGIALAASAAILVVPADGEGDSARGVYILLGLGLLLVLLQLVPMPANLWTGLPGRQELSRSYSLIGYPAPALPLSMAPYRSVMTLFALIPAVAVFAAAKLLRASPRWLALAIVTGTGCGIVLGALQVGNGQGSWAYLYDFTNGGAVGQFANRNHMGELLLLSIPFGVALLTSGKSTAGGSAQAKVAIGAAALLLIVVGIALNGSLTAIALLLPVTLASASLIPAAVRWRSLALPVAGIALVGAVALVAVNPIPAVVSDLGATTSVQTRGEIWGTTTRAIRDTFPAGSGLGTFEQAYRQYEDPSQVNNRYVNHAHNDYLELALELGLPGIVLMVLFLAWWSIAAARAWTSPLTTAFGRAATIASAVTLAHSIVDYPLRTGAISAIFGACLALMAQRLRSEPSARTGEMRPTRHVKLG